MSETTREQQQASDLAASPPTQPTIRATRVVQSIAQRMASVISRPTKASLEKLRVNELREELKRRNLNHFGKKAELVSRLHDAILRERAAQQPTPPAVPQAHPGVIPNMPGNVVGPPTAFYTQRMTPSLQPRYHMYSQPVPMHQVPMQMTSAIPTLSHPITVEDSTEAPNQPTYLGGPSRVEVLYQNKTSNASIEAKASVKVQQSISDEMAPTSAVEVIMGPQGIEKHVEISQPRHLSIQPSMQALQETASAGRGKIVPSGPQQLRRVINIGRSPMSSTEDLVPMDEKISPADYRTTGTFGSSQSVLDSALANVDEPITVKPYPGDTGDPSRPPAFVNPEGVSPTVDTFEINLPELLPIKGKQQKEAPIEESPLEHQDKRKIVESGVATDLEVNALAPPHKRQHTEALVRGPVEDRR